MEMIEKVKKSLLEAGYDGIKAEEFNGGVRLTGELDDYEDILECGRLAVNKKASRGVVNDIVLKGYKAEPMRVAKIDDKELDGLKPDALIVGGGIVGAAIARELSKYKLDVMLLEKEYDLATGQSSRNDGMIHAGIDLKPDSIKVKYNMRGNKLYDTLSKELAVPIRKAGQYVLFINGWQWLIYPFVKLRARQNNIPCRYVNKWDMAEKVKNPGHKHGGMFFAGAGVVSPYYMTLALAESAADNGVKICLNTAVTDIKNDGKRVTEVVTNRGTLYPKVLINAAGIWSDRIAEMAGDRHFTVHPRKGAEIILDKKAAYLTDSVVGKFAVKTSTGKGHTKGGGVVRTIDNNILVGPGAEETPERENDATTREEVDAVFEKQKQLTPDMVKGDIITYFAGTRASTYEEEFVVEKSPVISNLVQAAGIQSPGVTAAPAIAEDVTKWTKEILGGAEEKSDFIKFRKPIPCPRDMKEEERDALIKENPDFGEVVCRCEEVTKGEIIAALHTSVSVPTVDAIKRRVRAGMGRCQGGFCSPIVTELIAKEFGTDIVNVNKKGLNGYQLVCHTKEAEKNDK